MDLDVPARPQTRYPRPLEGVGERETGGHSTVPARGATIRRRRADAGQHWDEPSLTATGQQARHAPERTSEISTSANPALIADPSVPDDRHSFGIGIHALADDNVK